MSNRGDLDDLAVARDVSDWMGLVPDDQFDAEYAAVRRDGAEEVPQEVAVAEGGVEDDIGSWFGAAAEAKPTLTVSAVGGRAVVVDRAAFEALVADAGIAVGPDFTRVVLGDLITAAKAANQAILLDALLEIRSDSAPLYRVRTADGKTWRAARKPVGAAAAAEGDPVAADIHSYYRSDT